MAANTICSDTEMPLTVSGEMNIWYWQYSAPASDVINAEITVILSFSAVTLTPAAAAASSSSEMASSAWRSMLPSTQRQIARPRAQTPSAIRYQVTLSSNCSASRWLPLVRSGVYPSEPPV